jgi:CubicO group peptidase (beta-lactamase class C family)
MPATPYYPGPGDQWQHRSPDEAGFDADRLATAVAFATANETAWPRDLHAAIAQNTAPEGENGAVLGPIKDRGAPNGVILRHGYIVAEWGDTSRVDMTFSISKSYLATVAGLAVDAGLIRDLDEPIRETVDDGGFDPPHNHAITWRHLLQQTSEWNGTLWGKPDSVDHDRATQGSANVVKTGQPRELRAPGTHWEYNDVRVNRLALALLRRWGRPLPGLFKEAIMDPIGASDTWVWNGYDNSFVTLDGSPNGERVQSVSGGGHWGGGVWVNALDHARFGYLHLRRGRWEDRQLVSEAWVAAATTPCPINPVYGYLWWLNTDRLYYPSAPATSYFAIGWGPNVIWIDPDHDMVAVIRWTDGEAVDGVIQRVLAAL